MISYMKKKDIIASLASYGEDDDIIFLGSPTSSYTNTVKAFKTGQEFWEGIRTKQVDWYTNQIFATGVALTEQRAIKNQAEEKLAVKETKTWRNKLIKADNAIARLEYDCKRYAKSLTAYEKGTWEDYRDGKIY